MGFEIREMLPSDYDAVLALWQATPGVLVRPGTDSREGIGRLLLRNPGLSVVAIESDRVIGCALASHDGRRGYLQHVVVVPPARGRGIAKAMVDSCVERLRQEQLGWVHLDVAIENHDGLAFWQKTGWRPREELIRLSRPL